MTRYAVTIEDSESHSNIVETFASKEAALAWIHAQLAQSAGGYAYHLWYLADTYTFKAVYTEV